MSFDGTWEIEIATPIGKQQVLLQIVDRDGVVSGTATQGAEVAPFMDAVIEGHRIRWTQKITKPMSLVIKFDLQREGDRLLGTAKPGILPTSKVSGTRKTDSGDKQ